MVERRGPLPPDEAILVDGDEELAKGRVGQTIGGRWRLDRVLGVGGMAAVYEARDATGSVVALKLLHPEVAVKRDVRERFLREGYVANHLGHPGVVRALEHGDGSADGVFLAMELLVGETLAARVKRHGRLPIEELVEYTDQILDVLIVAHEKGVVHRDLKPDNLFVTTEGRIKILDFGLARLLDGMQGDHKTRTGLALGTLPYMAPEQALGRRNEIDGRVDLFALGATMFRILSGRKVHEANSEAELLMAMASRPAPPLKSIAPDTPDGLCAVIDLALAFSRDARYPDARTMQADLRAVRAGQAPSYANSRFSAREEATRADRTVPSIPKPFENSPTSQRATVPLSAYGAAGGLSTTLPPGNAPPLGTTLAPGTAPPYGTTVPPGTAPAFGSTLAPGSALPPASLPYSGPANAYGAAAPPPPASYPHAAGFNSAVPMTASTPGQAPPPPRKRMAPVLAAVAALLVVSGAAAAFWLSRSSNEETASSATASSPAVAVAPPTGTLASPSDSEGAVSPPSSSPRAASPEPLAAVAAATARAPAPDQKDEEQGASLASSAAALAAPSEVPAAAPAAAPSSSAEATTPAPEPAAPAAPSAAPPPSPPAPAAPKAAPTPVTPTKPTPQAPGKKGKGGKKNKDLGL